MQALGMRRPPEAARRAPAPEGIDVRRQMKHSFLTDGIGLWAQRMTRVDFEGRPAVFLDRDGVIADDVHFLASRKDVRLTFGVGEAIAALNRISVAVVVVTNQSGIAR